MSKVQKFDKFSILTLNNGLRALIYPRKEVNSIAILAATRAGHLNEEVEQNGIAHILEHMIFDGTEKFPSFKKLTDFFDRIAGEFSGATTYDFITIGGIFVDEELENALSVLDQLLFHSLLKKDFLKKEKSIILDELSTLEDNNNYINFIEAKKIRFKAKTILSQPLGGTVKSIKSITINQVTNFYKYYFVPNNINLVIVGNCDTTKTQNIVKQIFSSYPTNPKLKYNQFSRNQFTRKKIALINKKSEKAYLRITFPSFSWKDEILDRVALAYLCSLLANRRDSLLFSLLREEKGWIYDINCDFLVGFDIGVLEIETSTPTNKLEKVTEEILKAIKRVKVKMFDKEFFEKVKDIDRKRMKMVFDTPEGILRWFSEEISYRYPRILLPQDLIKIYNKITTSDIMRVAKKILDLEKINVCILKHLDDKDTKCYKKGIEKLISSCK